MQFGPAIWRHFLAAFLLVTVGFTPVAAAPNDITGAVNAQASSDLTHASPQFRSALQMIASEDYVGAYGLARGFPDPQERRAIQWAAIYFGAGAVDHQTVLRFAADSPDLASTTLYKTRLEQALVQSGASYSEVISLLGGEMPQTVDAQILLARAYVADGQVERALRIARQVWITNFLTSEQEAVMMRDFAARLSNADHWERAVHLLMHDRARGTERIMHFLTSAQKSLALARIAVARTQSNASNLLDAVDPSLRNHPLFHFSRGQHARRQGNLTAAVDLYNQVGDGHLPDAAEWWYERRYLGRKLIQIGRPQDAYRLVAFYEEGPEGRVVDANLHAGWIALHYLNDPASAERHFERMASLSTLESSITKAYYWLGRARTALGDDHGARDAFAVAAEYPTSYYGILAAYRLGAREIGFRPLPDTAGREPVFNQMQIVRIVRLMASSGQPRLAEPLVRRLIYSVSNPADMVLTARLAQSINAHNLAILMADIADQRGVPLDLFNYPRDGLPQVPHVAATDLAAVYAVARQESKFDFDVISAAGARGLMQLMPGTAKEVAQRLGMSYSPARLTGDPDYNATLGAAYLSRQLARYDNSLVLAAAAYNAGGGNVNKWVDWFGNPSHGGVDPVLWIELIPFAETRNYVQRVVANYLVYRARLGLPQRTVAEVLRRI